MCTSSTISSIAITSNAQEAHCFDSGSVPITVPPPSTQDSQEQSNTILESSRRSDTLSDRPAGSKKRKRGTSGDYEKKVLDSQLNVLAEEREMLEKRDRRDDELHSKKIAVIDCREAREKAVIEREEVRKDRLLAKKIAVIEREEARNKELHKIKMALHEAQARNMR